MLFEMWMVTRVSGVTVWGPTKEANKPRIQDRQMGLPICPTAAGQGRHRQSRLWTGWPSRVTLNPADDAEIPGTRTPGRRPGSPSGSSLRMSEEDKLASSCWKFLEDLGAKKMDALRGDTVGKGISHCPPALQKVGNRT